MRGLLLLLLCSATAASDEPDLVERKVHVGRHTYQLLVPKGKHVIDSHTSIHGGGFEVRYADGSVVFGLNDSGIDSPTRQFYSSVNFTRYLYRGTDTTIAGNQADGKVWKERIFSGEGGYSVGYINVSRERQKLYDAVLASFLMKK